MRCALYQSIMETFRRSQMKRTVNDTCSDHIPTLKTKFHPRMLIRPAGSLMSDAAQM